MLLSKINYCTNVLPFNVWLGLDAVFTILKVFLIWNNYYVKKNPGPVMCLVLNGMLRNYLSISFT